MNTDQLISIVGNNGEALIELIEKSKVFECLKRVSRGIDRFDRELFLSAYHEDAVIAAGAMVTNPASAFDGGAALHDDGQTATQHHLTNHRSEISGDVAHCETYYFYIGVNRDGTNWLASGRYIDRVERRDGTWRIAFRQTLIEASGTMVGNEVPLFSGETDAAMNGLPSRDRNDPSYRRPLVNLRGHHVPENIGELGRID